MRYVAKPVVVEAFEILEVSFGPAMPVLRLSEGRIAVASREMTCRLEGGVKVGDYWVEQADGYVYLNPKEVFERKYSRVQYGPDGVTELPIAG